MVALGQITADSPTFQGPLAIPHIDDPTKITQTYQSIIGHWFTAITSVTLKIFGMLAGIDFMVFTAHLMLNKHSWDTGMLSITKKLMSVGFFYTLLLNGAAWMPEIINLFVGVGRLGSGLSSLGPSEILGTGVDVTGTLLWVGVKSAFSSNTMCAVGIILGALGVFVAFGMLTAHFITAQIEIYYSMALGQLFLSFGGSRWTVPYVERYFSYCVQAGLKMLVMYIAVAAAKVIGPQWAAQAKALDGNAVGVVMGGWMIAASAFVFAYVTWFSGKMASAVLGGSPVMSGADLGSFMRPVVTAAVGAAGIAAGGAGAAASAGGAMKGAAGGASGALAGGGASAMTSVPSAMLNASKILSTAATSMPNGHGNPVSAPSHKVGH